MTTSEHALNLDGPGELLQTLPYLLGFHPDDSVVLVGLDQTRLVVTTRIDLDTAHEQAIVDDSVRILLQARASLAIIVVYAAPADPPMRSVPPGWSLPHQVVAAVTMAAIRAAGLSALDTLYVQDGHWWSYPGHASGCPCCVNGATLPGDRATGPAAAVFAGMQAYESRDALEAVLDADPAPRREHQRGLIEAAERGLVQAAAAGRRERELRSLKRALFAAARDADRALFPRPANVVSSASLARFAVGLSDVSVRDALWLAIDQQRLDGRGFWLQLLQRLPAPYDSAPLFLFGWATWRDGNGTLASIAAQRALASRPGYTAAELLLSAVQQGLDPFRTPRLRRTGRAGRPDEQPDRPNPA